jgi:chromosome segregation ATPase
MARKPDTWCSSCLLFFFWSSLACLVSPLPSQEALNPNSETTLTPSMETIANFETALTRLQVLWNEQTARHEQLKQNATEQSQQTTSLENIYKQQILADESLNASLGAVTASLTDAVTQTQAAQSSLQNASATLSSSEATLKDLNKQVKRLEVSNVILKWLAGIVGGCSLIEGGILTGHYLLSWW